MSILELESDNRIGVLQSGGTIMMPNPKTPERISVSFNREARTTTNSPLGAARRISSSADELMFAWSMSATRTPSSVQTPSRVSRESCPPEVYLG